MLANFDVAGVFGGGSFLKIFFFMKIVWETPTKNVNIYGTMVFGITNLIFFFCNLKRENCRGLL